MRALVLGIDGYLGWPLTCALASRGNYVMGIDSGLRRQLVRDQRSISAIEILPLDDRVKRLNDLYLQTVDYVRADLSAEYDILKGIIDDFKPTVIFHLGQMPSAPFSMKGRRECIFTHQNNMLSTLNLLYAVRKVEPKPHIIKIGTMGEFGTPALPIPEGEAIVTVGDRSASMSFPRSAGSWYHQTKVHDTHNIRMACNHWGLSCTDIMQGIVYGTRVRAMAPDARALATRLDFDECFGTIINRFVVQAVSGHPLTVYGQGTQIRSILSLQDSINCMLLLAKNPAGPGQYREVNQFHEYMSLNDMARVVSTAAYELTGKESEVRHISNPRIESENHVYEPHAEKLKFLGYENSDCIEKVVRCMVVDTFENRHVLRNFHNVINPTVGWSGDTHTATILHRN
jgi:nucleoside-diphosphate-sugar epimerase